MNNLEVNDLSVEAFPNGIKVYQSLNGYKFTKDAIDLAKFCQIKATDHVLELCAGTGVISFYAYSLNNFEKLYLNEIQDYYCEIIKENINLNKLDNAVCLNGDLNDLNISKFIRKLDVIICNPPYFKIESKSDKLNEDYSKAIARHEILVTLEQVIEKASQLIKEKGRFYLVHLSSRLQEIMTLFKKHKFECKRIKFLTNKFFKADIALFEAVYKGKDGVQISVEIKHN